MIISYTGTEQADSIRNDIMNIIIIICILYFIKIIFNLYIIAVTHLSLLHLEVVAIFFFFNLLNVLWLLKSVSRQRIPSTHRQDCGLPS